MGNPTFLSILRKSACAWLAAGLAPAWAETTDLTDLPFDSLTSVQVSTASRFVQSSREAPSAVQVIQREDIRRHGWRSLTEALNSLPGFYTVTDGAYDFAGARGFLVPGDYNTRFLLLVDGSRLNDNIYQQALLGDEFPLDMSLIERIEYVPGPGSSVYGGNAIFGVINVITRKAAELPPLAVTTLLSTDRRRQATLSATRRLDSGATWLASVGGGYREPRNRQYQDPFGGLTVAGGLPSPDGVAHDRDELETRRLLLRYEDGGFSATGRYGQRRVEPSSALYGAVFDEPSQYLDDAYWSLSGQYTAPVGKNLSLEARLELARYTYQADSPYPDTAGAIYLNHDDTLGEWWAGELRLRHTGLARHKPIAGVELRYDLKAQQRNYDRNAAINPAVDITGRSHNTGFYLQDEWTLSDHWRLNGGMRLDNDPDSDSVTSPRLGLIWLADSRRTLKLLAGKAYRPANTYERDYGNGINYLANPGLKPETIRTLEAVLEQDFSPSRRLTVSAYRYTLEDLISQQTLPGGGLQYQNQAHIEANGLELSWSARLQSGATLSASAATGNAEDNQGNRISYSPRRILKLQAVLPLPANRWRLAADAGCLSRTSYRWQGTNLSLKARCLLNLNLSAIGLSRGLDLNVRLVNVFDQSYQLPSSEEIPVPAIPGNARTLEAGLRYAF